MGMILRIASSRIVGQGDIVGRSGYFSLNLSANSVMRGRLDARRTLKSLVADLREEKKDSRRVIDIVRASSSLPFVCPITYVDGIPMLDGGIVDSIPLQRAITDGCTRNVVVLTRNRGYRKDSKDIRIPSFVYRKYPKLREALSRRCAVYNEQLEMVERMEDEGQIIVIRPLKPVAVDRIEKDVQKLTEFYQEGYECARALLEE